MSVSALEVYLGPLSDQKRFPMKKWPPPCGPAVSGPVPEKCSADRQLTCGAVSLDIAQCCWTVGSKLVFWSSAVSGAQWPKHSSVSCGWLKGVSFSMTPQCLLWLAKREVAPSMRTSRVRPSAREVQCRQTADVWRCHTGHCSVLLDCGQQAGPLVICCLRCTMAKV
ncbi:hypothetical protein ACOMHN_050671 [Nucella lapillus]